MRKRDYWVFSIEFCAMSSVEIVNFFSVKGQIVNILCFVSHTISVTTTKFSHHSAKAAVDNVECSCVSMKLYS